MDINFLEKLVERLNEQIIRATNNDCNADEWIQNKLKFNKYIKYNNGQFEVDIF